MESASPPPWWRSDRAIDAGLVLLLVGLFAVLTLLSDRVTPGSNPDQWYHFAISRMSQHGLVRTLPQVEDLGWGRSFPEKEFLFHVWTALGWALGGERGVTLLCRLLSAGSIALIYLLARRRAGPVVSFAAVAGLVLCNGYLVFRMGMVRPHVLAIFSFLLMAAGLLRRSVLFTFLAAAVSALAYHAFYVPGAFAAGFLVVGLWRRRFLHEPDEGILRVSLAAFAGLVAGIVVNPYFPSNVGMGLKVFTYALSAEASLPGVHPGAEVMPLPFPLFLRIFGPGLVAVLAAAWMLRGDVRAGERPWDRAVVTAAALFLVGAGARSARTGEFAFPLAAIALAWELGAPRRAARIRQIAVALVLLAPAVLIARELSREPDRVAPRMVAEVNAAIDSIPADATNAKVFDCDWNFGSFLLYRRPDLRFVDLLDPRLLLVNPPLFEAKRRLDLDIDPDPVATLRGAFRARYVLCANPRLSAHLARDSRVRELHPGLVHLFEITGD